MSYFNQKKYSESTENTDSEKSENVEKGHKNITKVDIGKFDELCKKFKEKRDLKIKKLSGTDKEDFDLIVSYVHLLYGTSYYSHLYEKVRKHFDNIISIQPGTVGAYFAGCLANTKDSSVSPGCSISCAGSMPRPKDEEGWSFCDKAVILAENNKEGYTFSLIKPANIEEEMDPAYIFVDSKTLHDFKGFSKEEKDYLRATGCKKAKLIGYDNNLTYSELYKDPKPIHEIKHRHAYIHKKEKDESNSGLTIGIIIFMIVLILILCLLGYKHYKN